MKPKVLIGVTGGIAAYKAADIVSQLVKANVDVRVVMTEAATRFVAPLTFAALTQQKVITSLFPDTSSGEKDVIYPHLYPAMEADAFAVIPATADAMAKLAHGFGDDIVCCSALSLKADCKRIFCPAMNVQMWEQPIVRENAKKLLQLGWHQIGPEKGRLACGTYGYGRMSTPTAIAQVILNSVL
ncbi:MAG: phosphopantothenoylcysteine decarboxylase [Kiritimatiellales bacterium]|nr:phosphopantothenoylcysteine decarboxylase [Kiritimatiellales bacterium]